MTAVFGLDDAARAPTAAPARSPHELSPERRRAASAASPSWAARGVFGLLLSAFFRTQIVQDTKYSLQSEENRLREVPLPAPRGIIYDRDGQIIAENVPGYSVSMLAPSADSLRATLKRLCRDRPLSPEQIEPRSAAIARAPNRPTVIFADASFDVVSVLEEHRIDFPGLIIQSAPKRYYPGRARGRRRSSATWARSRRPSWRHAAVRGLQGRQQIGKGGLEKQYESRAARARRRCGSSKWMRADACVREAGARVRISTREAAAALHEHRPRSAAVHRDDVRRLARRAARSRSIPRRARCSRCYSAPSFDPNRFIGGIPADYWKQLSRRSAAAAVQQGDAGHAIRRARPGSWRRRSIALEDGLVTLDDAHADSRAPAATSSAIATSAAGRSSGHGSRHAGRARSRSRATSTSISSA